MEPSISPESEGNGPATDGNNRLHQWVRDLVSISALPALWIGQDSASIQKGFTSLLMRVLDLDVVFLRIRSLDRQSATDAIRIAPALNESTDSEYWQSVVASQVANVVNIGPDVEPVTLFRVGLGFDEASGFVRVGSRRSGFPDSMETLLLQVATNQFTVALQSLQSIHREARHASYFKALTECALAINANFTVEAMLQTITDQAAIAVRAHQSVTSLTTGGNEEQSINAVHLSEKYAASRTYSAMPDGSGMVALVCKTNRVMRMTHAELTSHPAWRGVEAEAAHHPPMRGWLAAPLVARDGKNFGLIQLSDKVSGEFTAEDEAFLVQLAQMASIAIENAQLYRKAQEEITDRKNAEQELFRQSREARLMAEVGAAMTTSQSLREALQRCAEAIVRGLDAAFARVWVLPPQSKILQLEASAGQYTHLDGAYSRIPLGAFKIGRIAQEAKAHLSNDVPNDPEIKDREWARREGMRAFAGYPLLVNDHVVGVVALFARHPLAQSTLQTLALVADMLATGVRRRYAEDEVQKKTKQLELITESLTSFVETGDWGKSSLRLLQGALRESQSEYGFFGVVLKGPVLRVLAFDGFVWDPIENRAFYDSFVTVFQKQKYLDFPQMDNLFGWVIRHGEALLTNAPGADSRGGGIPKGHPKLDSFLGVPIVGEMGVIGLIGLANRPGGFTLADRENLELLSRISSVLCKNYLNHLQQASLEEAQRHGSFIFGNGACFRNGPGS